MTTTDTRTRVLDASTELFRRQGMTGTGLKQIAVAASAPFGSIYHFFPGGKTELVATVLRESGAMYRDLVMSFFAETDDLVGAIDTAFAAAADVLEATGYADACPIETIALEVASTDDALRQVTAEVFTDWIETGASHLVDQGLSPQAARRLIIGFITSLEGAFVLSRSMRTPEPLLVAGQTVRAAAVAELAAAPTTDRGADRRTSARSVNG